MNILPALIIEINHVYFVFALKKGLSIFPVMHGVDEHSFEFVDCMIEPNNVSKVVLINSSKVDFIIKIVRLLDNVKKLFWKFVIIF